MWDAMRAEIEELCAARGLRLEVVEPHRAPAAPCATWLQEAVVAGIRTDRRPATRWACGAAPATTRWRWPRSPTSACCSCAASTASATTPTRTSARSTSPSASTRSRQRCSRSPQRQLGDPELWRTRLMDLSTSPPTAGAERPRATSRCAAGETVLAGGTWLFSEPQPGTHRPGRPDHAGLAGLGARSTAACGSRATCTVERAARRPPWGRHGRAWSGQLRRRAPDVVQGPARRHRRRQRLPGPAGRRDDLAAGRPGRRRPWCWTPDGGERREPVADLVTRRAHHHACARRGRSARVDVPAASPRRRHAFRRARLAPLGRSSAVVVGRRRRRRRRLTLTAATTRPVVLELGPPELADELAAGRRRLLVRRPARRRRLARRR